MFNAKRKQLFLLLVLEVRATPQRFIWFVVFPRGVKGHGEGGWAHQRNATHSRGVRGNFRPPVSTTSKIVQAANRSEPGRSALLRGRWVAQHFRLFGQNQKGPRAPCNVLRLQERRRLPLQGEVAAKEEAHGQSLLRTIINYTSRARYRDRAESWKGKPKRRQRPQRTFFAFWCARSFSFIKWKPLILETWFLSHSLGNFVDLNFYSDHFFS